MKKEFPGAWTAETFSAALLRTPGFRLSTYKAGGTFKDLIVTYQGEHFGAVRILKKSGKAEYDAGGSMTWAPWQVAEVTKALAKENAVDRTIVKTCGCGRVYTKAGWKKLPLAYVGDLDTDGDQRAEFRHCACKSTIAIDRKTGKGIEKNPGKPRGASLTRAELSYRAGHWGKGGKQKPRQLACADPFAPDAGPVVVIGRLVAIEYETDKFGDGMSVYRHDVESKDATIGHLKNGRLVIGGEKIKMTIRGIVN